MTGSSTQGIKTVLHPVTDLAKSKAMYAALLGVEPSADAPYYVGFDAEGQHIGLVPGAGPVSCARASAALFESGQNERGYAGEHREGVTVPTDGAVDRRCTPIRTC